MKTINDLAKNPNIWCGLNRPEMNEDTADAVIFGIPFDEGVIQINDRRSMTVFKHDGSVERITIDVPMWGVSA